MQNGRAKICDDSKNAHQIVISVHLLTKFHKKQVTICKNRIKFFIPIHVYSILST